MKAELRKGPWKRRRVDSLKKSLQFSTVEDLRAAAPHVGAVIEVEDGVEYIRLLAA